MPELTAAQRDKLMADLKLVIADTEELLRVTAGQAGEHTKELRNRMQARLDEAKKSLMHLQDAAVAKAKAAGHAADEFVHENPWKAIGAAAGVGLIAGLLIGRR
jgi:ElaB/YqjD/DUF883 family membrane-anchored ribosome-binding protein